MASCGFISSVGCSSGASLAAHSHALVLLPGHRTRPVPAPPTLPCSHVERTLETFCNMNLEMQETQNIGKINKQVGRGRLRLGY